MDGADPRRRATVRSRRTAADRRLTIASQRRGGASGTLSQSHPRAAGRLATLVHATRESPQQRAAALDKTS
jgi:hypothetical protein